MASAWMPSGLLAKTNARRSSWNVSSMTWTLSSSDSESRASMCARISPGCWSLQTKAMKKYS
jgi:hypothetical protein